MNKFGVLLSSLAAMFVLTVPTFAEEGGDNQDEGKKLSSELRSVTGKVSARTQKLIKENPEYQGEYDKIREKQKELEEARNALYAKIAEKDPELKELIAKKDEISKKMAGMKKGKEKTPEKVNTKGKKNKEEAK